MADKVAEKAGAQYPSRRTLLTTGMVGAAGAAAATAMGNSGAMAQSSSGRMLDGQTAFVTGAARGIGRAISIALAEAGADVAGFDIQEDIEGLLVPMATPADMAATREAVEAAGGRFLSLQGDIRDFAGLQGALAETEAAVGPIGILVANAGINSNAGFTTEDQASWESHWRLVTDVNVLGTANTIRATVPGMVQRAEGRVIIVSSTFGRQGNGSNPAYVASKWAMIGMVKALAIEVGRSGVTVNALAPTAVRTGLGGPQTAEQRTTADEWLKANYHQLDVGILEPRDVAGSVVFLASPAAAMITGSSIDVSAGAAARYTA